MNHLRRNKSELIVLTGAIYSFVAYLTAFALEILFLVDLTRRGNEILASLNGPGQPPPPPNEAAGAIAAATADDNRPLQASSIAATQEDQSTIGATSSATFDRLSFESMQAHITIACLAISILYFVIFITSLVVIVALILRSTFMLLIWMCAMTTMYLPELGLVLYVSVYSWGLDTRNGQTELAFYLFRAALNLIFIVRTHKLYKQWKHEKDFFRLKIGSMSNFSTQICLPYESPYFIGGRSGIGCGGGGDSLTTTINPIFSTSTLNLNNYDFVRDQYNHQLSTSSNSRCTSPATQNSVHDGSCLHFLTTRGRGFESAL